MSTYAWKDTKLAAAHLLAAVEDLRSMGCTALAYKNSNPANHRAGSWHGRKDAFGKYQLAADINAFNGNERKEFDFFKNTGQYIAKGHGLAICCGIYGFVPGHSIGAGLHLHIDTGYWCNIGNGDVRGSWCGKPTLPAWPVRSFQKQCNEKYNLKLDVDGIPGKATITELQKIVGTEADGIWGKNTTRAIQKLVGAEVDGILGGETYFKMGLAIEAGKLKG